jgi:nitroreductase
MDTWDAIRSRRNVRQFLDQPIPDEDLERILEAGWRAPSASNRQHRDFVVVTGRERLTELSNVWAHGRHVAESAATVVIVYPRSDDPRAAALDAFDQGQAAMQMELAAADLGIGSGHSSVGDQELARRLLGYPEDHAADIMIAFGYPADRPLRPVAHPNRRPMDEVVHRGRW